MAAVGAEHYLQDVVDASNGRRLFLSINPFLPLRPSDGPYLCNNRFISLLVPWHCVFGCTWQETKVAGIEKLTLEAIRPWDWIRQCRHSTGVE